MKAISERALDIQPGFTGFIDVRYVDGDTWILLSEFVYCSALLQTCVRVPAGTTTDFASIPRALWSLMPATHPQIAGAALIHDELYHQPAFRVSRKEADQVLVEGMALLGAPWWRRQIVYRAVRLLGGGGFRPRADEEGA